MKPILDENDTQRLIEAELYLITDWWVDDIPWSYDDRL